jgi:hypothetical protein
MDERIITVNVRVPVVYMARDVMILMRSTSITRAIGRGGGLKLKIKTFLGPEMATSEACTIWAQKKSGILRDGVYSASLCSLAARYDNAIPTRFLAPIDSLKIPAQGIFASVPVFLYF